MTDSLTGRIPQGSPPFHNIPTRASPAADFGLRFVRKGEDGVIHATLGGSRTVCGHNITLAFHVLPGQRRESPTCPQCQHLLAPTP